MSGTVGRAPSSAAPQLQPVIFEHVVVPLDTSSFSEIALGPARAVAQLHDAQVHLLGVGVEWAEAEVMARRFRTLAALTGATVETVVDWDVPARILDAARGHAPALVCMASHGRGRTGFTLVGSVASGVLAATRDPVLLVGPACAPVDPDAFRTATGPVVACVDGSPASEEVLPAAASWARSLGVPLAILTVAEPAPPHRPHGRVDVQRYVGQLAARWRQVGLEVEPVAIFDPIGAAAGIDRYLEDAAVSLLAVRTHARTGIARAVIGSQATAVVRVSRVPVLVVPPHHPELHGGRAS